MIFKILIIEKNCFDKFDLGSLKIIRLRHVIINANFYKRHIYVCIKRKLM